MFRLTSLKNVLALSRDVDVTMQDFRFGNSERHSESQIIEKTRQEHQRIPLVMTAHVYHLDFLDRLVPAINDLPLGSTVLITTPEPILRDRMLTGISNAGVTTDIRICPNRGRNFGPLLVEFSSELLKFDSFIHVHSKRSAHAGKSRSREWTDRVFSLLLDSEKIQRVLRISEFNPTVGLVYADVDDLFRGLSSRWGTNADPIRRRLAGASGFDGTKWCGRIAFPKGGMFWVRTSAIRPLLEESWSYQDFPEEKGQLDGTLHHGIERMIGQLCILEGQRHVVYNSKLDQFFRVDDAN